LHIAQTGGYADGNMYCLSDGNMYWPSQTEFLDGLLGKDLFSNYMLSVRLTIQHNFSITLNTSTTRPTDAVGGRHHWP